MSQRAPCRKLDEVVEIIKGTVPAKPRPEQEGVPYFGIHQISGGGVTWPAVVSADDVPAGAPRLKRGDIAIALTSSVGSSVCISALLESAVLGRDCVALRPRVTEIISAWVFAWTQSVQFRSQVNRHTSGGAVPRLNLTAFQEFIIPVPNLKMQLEARSMIDDFEPALAAAGGLLADLTELRRIEAELILNQLDLGPGDA